jgi:hypothetical protein
MPHRTNAKPECFVVHQEQAILSAIGVWTDQLPALITSLALLNGQPVVGGKLFDARSNRGKQVINRVGRCHS